ncbi:hypothetical protein [Micromonospora craniellae]|uniref:Uncharacterized protein n=1 Tax=Micromonospora craniellae TaxID=2294034 RepID=A0A372G0R5_9ACTN|nr:hypothetical protein [Micromonospora craniellae]QOC94575.1 hypothetical protein ID554_14030 [Micromonospora craniellae]RFS46366.1 hypothetical protein D0Q02_11315 [Micromonospora craniellae]
MTDVREWSAPPVVTVAAITVEVHGLRCADCTPDGCPRIGWASVVLDEHRAARRAWLEAHGVDTRAGS